MRSTFLPSGRHEPQEEEFAFVDNSGWHFSNDDGGRLYENGTKVMTLWQRAGEESLNGSLAASAQHWWRAV